MISVYVHGVSFLYNYHGCSSWGDDRENRGPLNSPESISGTSDVFIWQKLSLLGRVNKSMDKSANNDII